MTRRRFYAPPSAFTSRLGSVNLPADEARYLREVLRLKAGDTVYVFDGQGKEFHCRVEESRRDSAQLEVIAESTPARPESPLELRLAVALLKGDKFDLVVQKTTELGVKRILPVVTKRADVRLRDDSDVEKRIARWQRIALEAAKQSGRAVVPAVDNPVAFESLVQETGRDKTMGRLMFAEREGQSLLAAREHLPSDLSSLTTIVGSEGGWTDEDLGSARDAGWTIVTLGGRTLRAETAAITVVALLQHLYGDLG